MSNICKTTMISVLAIMLSFSLILTASALSWNNAGKFSGDGFNGRYSATVNVTADSATFKVSVSDYTGPAVLEGGVSCNVIVYCTNGTNIYHQMVNYSAQNRDSYTWNFVETYGLKISSVECHFYYMGCPIVSASVAAT